MRGDPIVPHQNTKTRIESTFLLGTHNQNNKIKQLTHPFVGAEEKGAREGSDRIFRVGLKGGRKKESRCFAKSMPSLSSKDSSPLKRHAESDPEGEPPIKKLELLHLGTAMRISIFISCLILLKLKLTHWRKAQQSPQTSKHKTKMN